MLFSRPATKYAIADAEDEALQSSLAVKRNLALPPLENVAALATLDPAPPQYAQSSGRQNVPSSLDLPGKSELTECRSVHMILSERHHISASGLSAHRSAQPQNAQPEYAQSQCAQPQYAQYAQPPPEEASAGVLRALRSVRSNAVAMRSLLTEDWAVGDAAMLNGTWVRWFELECGRGFGE